MTVIEKLLMLFVWLALMAGGVPFILRHWLARGEIEHGSIAAGLFIAIMTALCAVGGLAYASQDPAISRGPSSVSDSYLATLKTSAIWQLVLLTLGALMLDGGGALHLVVVGLAGYWPIVLIIVLRRPANPTKFDLLVIRHGFPFVYLAIAIVGAAVWTFMGRFGP